MRVVFAAAFAALSFVPALSEEVNVYTYREQGLIKPVFDAFTAKTGIKVNTVFASSGLEERIAAEGAGSPADLLMVVDATLLANAVAREITQPLKSDVLAAAVPAQLRDPDGHWYALTYRARVIYAAKARVSESVLTYEELAAPKWKGKFCVRDGQHGYNLALFAAGVAKFGEAKATEWISGLRDNLAKKPSGGDRDVARDIAAGICDVGFGNTYYVGLMQKDEKQKPWVEAIKVIVPTFKDGGTHVNISGIALTKHAPNRAAAVKLAEWLVSPEAQKMYAAGNFEYPVLAGAAVDPVIAAFGPIKVDATPLVEMAKARRTASEIVEKVGFNAGPRS